MGCICQKSDQRTDEITQANKQYMEENAKIMKLLLLGAGGSGKSTFFKQFRSLHGEPFSREYLTVIKQSIYDNIMTCINFLLDQAEEKGVEFENPTLDAVQIMRNAPGDADINPKYGSAIALIWQSEDIRAIFEYYTEEKADGRIQKTTALFLDNIARIAAHNYTPDEHDVMYVRARTTGICEQTILVPTSRGDRKFKVFDVGGQQNERRKWIHCFENVNGVLFVSSLTGYREMMWEDETQNRMVDSVELFRTICNSRWFKKSAMIVFLNKKDLFGPALKKTPLNTCVLFEHLDRDLTVKEGIAAISKLFQAQCRNKTKKVYIHATIAIDRNNVDVMFTSVKQKIMEDNLRNCGML